VLNSALPYLIRKHNDPRINRAPIISVNCSRGAPAALIDIMSQLHQLGARQGDLSKSLDAVQQSITEIVRMVLEVSDQHTVEGRPVPVFILMDEVQKFFREQSLKEDRILFDRLWKGHAAETRMAFAFTGSNMALTFCHWHQLMPNHYEFLSHSDPFALKVAVGKEVLDEFMLEMALSRGFKNDSAELKGVGLVRDAMVDFYHTTSPALLDFLVDDLVLGFVDFSSSSSTDGLSVCVPFLLGKTVGWYQVSARSGEVNRRRPQRQGDGRGKDMLCSVACRVFFPPCLVALRSTTVRTFPCSTR